MSDSVPDPDHTAEPDPERSWTTDGTVDIPVDAVRSDGAVETAAGRSMQVIGLGAGVAVLVVAAIAAIASLAGSDDPDRITIDAPADTTADSRPSTYDASIGGDVVVVPSTARDISITDEPIVIDADGNIVDPNGGGGAVTDAAGGNSGSGAAEGSTLDVPGDAYTQADRVDVGATDGNSPNTDAEAEPADNGTNLLGGDSPEDKRMPDLICRGLQAAQDEIQDRGVFGSKSEDATGRGRRQLWDRNWVVVAQDPAPGEKIGEFDAVLYVVKKDDDENICD
jgi:hypothetical protein